MQAVVVGPDGFLGRHVVAGLHDQGWRVEPLIRDPSTGDVVPGLVAALRAGPVDVVVNCAGRTDGAEEDVWRSNAVLPGRIAQAITGSLERTLLVHLGSAAEYGCACELEACTEQSPTRPLTGYGRSKLAGTVAVRDHLPDALVLRPTTVIGRGSRGFIATLCQQIADTGLAGPVLVGPLDSERDFVDVHDVARAVVAAATARPKAGGIFNVGSGKAVPLTTVVDAVRAVTGYIGPVTTRPGSPSPSAHLRRQSSNVDAARDVLGWTPRTTLTESIRTLWEALQRPPVTAR